jgi:hypothetical protein
MYMNIETFGLMRLYVKGYNFVDHCEGGSNRDQYVPDKINPQV